MNSHQQTQQEQNEMANLTQGAKGKTLVLTDEDGAQLASIFGARVSVRKLSTQAIGESSTLSEATILQRLRNSGGPRMSLWSYIALADALGVDPIKGAKRIGVELSPIDVAGSRALIASRRARKNGAEPEVVEQERPGMDEARAEALTFSSFEDYVEHIVNTRIEELLGA